MHKGHWRWRRFSLSGSSVLFSPVPLSCILFQQLSWFLHNRPLKWRPSPASCSCSFPRHTNHLPTGIPWLRDHPMKHPFRWLPSQFSHMESEGTAQARSTGTAPQWFLQHSVSHGHARCERVWSSALQGAFHRHATSALEMVVIHYLLYLWFLNPLEFSLILTPQSPITPVPVVNLWF